LALLELLSLDFFNTMGQLRRVATIGYFFGLASCYAELNGRL